MKQEPIAKLFGSATRVRLMRLFLFSPKRLFTQTEAAGRVRAPKSEVVRELKELKDAGFVRVSRGKKLRFTLSDKFPYAGELQHMFLTSSLQGSSIQERLRRAGAVRFIGASGMFMGDFEGKLDLLIAGDRLSESKVKRAVQALEADLGAELHYATIATSDFLYRLTVSDRFLRDFFDYPHLVLLDRLNLAVERQLP